MADVGIWTTNASIQAKAGANANATGKSTAETDKYVLQVESFVNVATRRNWSDTYSSLNVDVKNLLLEATSNICAIYVINYNMAGFTSRIEAEDMINFLWARAQQCIELLKDQKSVTYVAGTGTP